MQRLALMLAGVCLSSLLPTAIASAQTVVPCDVVVVGDSLGGIGAAVSSARMGADTCLLATVGYSGGQATAAGVSTMDEGSPILRRSGLYAELVNELQARLSQDALNRAYYGNYIGSQTLGPDPHSVKQILDEWVAAAGVRVYPYVQPLEVEQDASGRPYGVLGSDGNIYQGVLIDATETQETFPMIDGLNFLAGDGSCVQDITWTVVMRWYDNIPDDLWVPVNAQYQLRRVYGEEVDLWLAEFRRLLSVDGAVATTSIWEDIQGNVTLRFSEGYAGYRGMTGISDPGSPTVSRTGLNWANDSGLLTSALAEQATRQDAYLRAMAKTYLLMWFIRHELHEEHWAIANDLGYDGVPRPLNHQLITDRIERHFPPLPYIREGRRLAAPVLTARDLSVRGVDRWSTSVEVGAYFTDTHNCDLAMEDRSGEGLYDVPLEIFLPADVDNFLIAIPRAGRVDRAVASSLRMQPTELNGGQVAGVLAAMAVSRGVEPRGVDVDEFRQTLLELGVVIDVTP